MTNDTLTPLQQILVKDEGIVLSPMKDTLGNWMYGIGRNIGTDLKMLTISPRVARVMLEEDIETATQRAVSIFGEEYLSTIAPARRDAIVSLIFNMGKGNSRRGFLSFVKAIQAMREHRWDIAAKEVLDSQWAHTVDPKDRDGVGRDDRIAFMLRTGEYHEEYRIRDL